MGWNRVRPHMFKARESFSKNLRAFLEAYPKGGPLNLWTLSGCAAPICAKSCGTWFAQIGSVGQAVSPIRSIWANYVFVHKPDVESPAETFIVRFCHAQVKETASNGSRQNRLANKSGLLVLHNHWHTLLFSFCSVQLMFGRLQRAFEQFQSHTKGCFMAIWQRILGLELLVDTGRIFNIGPTRRFAEGSLQQPRDGKACHRETEGPAQHSNS